jgi:hypothetical protein
MLDHYTDCRLFTKRHDEILTESAEICPELGKQKQQWLHCLINNHVLYGEALWI